MSKQKILELSDEDIKLINKFEKIAKENLKSQYKGAILALDKMWQQIIDNDNNSLIKMFVRIGKKWSDLTPIQISKLPEAYAKSVNEKQKNDDDLLDKIKTLESKVESLEEVNKNLEKENKLLEERVNIKLPTDADKIRYLAERDLILTKLERAGVDNWEWYCDALNDTLE